MGACSLAAHRLVNSKRVRLGDLKGEPFVWFPRTVAAPLYDRILSKCHAAGLTLNIVQEGNSLTTIMSLVARDRSLFHHQVSGEDEARQVSVKRGRRPAAQLGVLCHLEGRQ